MPTADDREAARTSGREANAALFATLRDKHRALADLHRQGAERETAAGEAVDRLEASHADRRFLRSLGVTAADLRDCQDLAALCELVGEDRIIPMLARESVQAGHRASRKAVRSLLAVLTPRATSP
jgi:hypothetical protein